MLLRLFPAVVAVAMLSLGANCGYGQECQPPDASAQGQPKKVTAKAVFEVVSAVGEIIGTVFDILSSFAPDPAQEELNSKLDNMSAKLDSIQIQIAEMSAQVATLSQELRISTGEIMNQVTQTNIADASSNIKTYCDNLKNKIADLKATKVKDTAFWDGFDDAVKTTCTDASALEMKREMARLLTHMTGENGSYTGGLDAYTNVVINRVTIPETGEAAPLGNLSSGYEMLASYYSEKAMRLYDGLSFLQAYYYANNRRSEFFLYHQNNFAPEMDKMAAKFLGCVNRLAAAQANLRSVNDQAYLNLFKEISYYEQVVYSQALVEGVCQKADLLAAVTGGLKVKGKATVQDDKGNTKEVDELVNRKKLGVFLRYFSEPSMLPTNAYISSTAGGAASMEIFPGANYANLVPASNHLDWQWGLTKDENRFWRKTDKLAFALFRHMDESMADSGKWRLSHAISLPLGAGRRDATSSGDYSLVDYDLSAGQPANATTPEANKAKLQFIYAADAIRGYRPSAWQTKWETAKTYVTWGDHNAVRDWMNPNTSPNTYSFDEATGRVRTHIAGRYTGYHSYYGYNRYAIWPKDCCRWVNAGDRAATISVNAPYYLKEGIARMSGRLWVACALENGLIRTDPDHYDLNWGLSTSAEHTNAAPFKEVSVTDPAETRSYIIQPRLTVDPRNAVSFSLHLYEALSHKWAWFKAQDNFLDADFGSQTGVYDILVSAKIPQSVWIEPGAAAKGADSAAAPSFAVVSMPKGAKTMNVLELECPAATFTKLALGDFNGDKDEDCLVMSADNSAICFISLNIGEPAAQKTQPLTQRVAPDIGTLHVLAEGESYVATGDFNGDGTTDLLLRQPDGSLAVLYVNCGAATSKATVATAAIGDLLCTGDFNGDGLDDLLFHDNAANRYTIVFSGDALPPHVIPNECVAGKDSSLFDVDDCNGDEIADLIWTDNATSAIFITCFGADGKVLMDGPVVKMRGEPWRKGWKLFAVADLNFDGCADYLWHSEGKRGNSKFRVNFMSGFEPAPKSGPWRSGLVRLPKQASLPANAEDMEQD